MAPLGTADEVLVPVVLEAAEDAELTFPEPIPPVEDDPLGRRLPPPPPTGVVLPRDE